MLSRRLLRIKVIKALFALIQSGAKNLPAAEKSLVLSIDKAYDLYVQMLTLAGEVARYAEQRIEIGLQKQLPTDEERNPNRKFVENYVIATLTEDKNINDYCTKHSLGWAQNPELAKSLFTAFAESEAYQKYMQTRDHSFAEDMQLVEAFYESLEDNETLDAVLEEQSLMWNDDLNFALILVLRTLSKLRQSHTSVTLLPKFKSEDDLTFARDLFAKTALNYADDTLYIDRYTQNWDVDRVVFMDRLIMATAMTELTDFPSIPVKVTLDEYIEIAKYYSTPGSSVFINGILDRMIADLTREGKIAKSGKGLM